MFFAGGIEHVFQLALQKGCFRYLMQSRDLLIDSKGIQSKLDSCRITYCWN